MGVHMGDELMEPGPANPHGYWEDMDWFRLNVDILREAGGDWANPPEREAIEHVGRENMRHAIANMVTMKDGHLWGFKDPRNCLTIPVIHPHLTDPRYVVVQRDRQDILTSMTDSAWSNGQTTANDP